MRREGERELDKRGEGKRAREKLIKGYIDSWRHLKKCSGGGGRDKEKEKEREVEGDRVREREKERERHRDRLGR